MAISSISRRMEDSIRAFMNNDYETCLIHYFPALDKTAKRRRNEGVGKRIRGFLDDELDIITYVALQNIFRIDCDGVSIPEAIYKFGRTSIAHEGELDSRLNFNNQTGMSIGPTWNLPPSFITGMLVAVIVAPENINESFDNDYSFSIHGTNFNVSELWGNRQLIRDWMENIYQRPIFGTET